MRLLSRQLNKQEVQRAQEAPRFGEGVPFVPFSVSLPIYDCTESWESYASGGFAASGEKVFEMVKVIEYRSFAWTFAQGYEAFETFLKDVIAAYLLKNPHQADKKAEGEFRRYLTKKNRTYSGIKYWRAFVEYGYKGRHNSGFMTLLRNLAPDIAAMENKIRDRLCLPRWYETTGIVRDTVTHANCIFARGDRPEHARLLRRYKRFFPVRKESGVRKLRMTLNKTEVALGMLGGYAYLIFKGLSQQAGYHWRIFDKGWSTNIGKAHA